jgi:hypothetical protein
MMMLAQVQVQEQKLETKLEQKFEMRLDQLTELTSTGGCSQTVFPRAEKELQSSSRAQKAISFVRTGSNPEKYWSVMDWLFCCVYPQERANCFAYYRGKGAPLFELRSKKELRFYDRVLVGALRKAEEALEKDEMRRWSEISREAKEEVRLRDCRATR